MAEKRKFLVKCLLFAAFAGAAACVLFLTPVGTLCLTPEGRKELVSRIDLLVRSAGPLGPPLFVLIYAIGAQFLPATPFSAAGAFIFGKYLGGVLNTFGAVSGAALSFCLARYFFRDAAKRLLSGRFEALDRKVENHGFSVIFYLRIVWFPFIVLNYAAGATRVRFGDFLWGTVLGILPAVLITSFFFGSLKEIVATFRGPADLLQPNVLVPAALLVCSFFLPGLVKRFRKDRISDVIPRDE